MGGGGGGKTNPPSPPPPPPLSYSLLLVSVSTSALSHLVLGQPLVDAVVRVGRRAARAEGGVWDHGGVWPCSSIWYRFSG
jgi:hypothetical protein